MAEWTAITGADVKDIRFSLTPEGVDPTTRQTLLDNFGSYGFANSETAMKNIASSSTVMDEVTSSQAAMDDISASIRGRSTVIGSPHSIDTLWSKQTSSESWLNGFQNQSGSGIVNGPTSNGKAVELSASDIGSTSMREWELDLGEFSKLEWKDRVPNIDGEDNRIKLKINGERVYRRGYDSTQGSWVTRTVDINKYGLSDVMFRLKNGPFSNAYMEAQIGDILLIK